jgi:hypothetical protein
VPILESFYNYYEEVSFVVSALKIIVRTAQKNAISYGIQPAEGTMATAHLSPNYSQRQF